MLVDEVNDRTFIHMWYDSDESLITWCRKRYQKKNKKNNLKESGVLYFTLGVGKVKKSQKWSENQTYV